MLRMLPPASSNAPAQKSRSSVVVARARRARGACSQIRAPVRGVGHREVDERVEPARERRVDVRAQVGGEDDDAVERLHALQQVGDLDVGVAVVGVADLRALAEQRVRLVEEQHAVHALGLVEDAVEVLLRLADVLVDDGGEVDRVEVEAQLAGDHLGGHRLAGPRRPGEQRRDALAAATAALHAPRLEHRSRAGARARRARAAAPAGRAGRTMSSQPTLGSIAVREPLERRRRSGRARPRARARTSTARPRRRRAARPPPPRARSPRAPSLYAAVAASSGSRGRRRSAPPARAPSAGSRCGGAEVQDERRRRAPTPASQDAAPVSATGQLASANARTAGAPPRSASASTGPATSPAARSRASRTAARATVAHVRRLRRGERRSSTTRPDRAPGSPRPRAPAPDGHRPLAHVDQPRAALESRGRAPPGRRRGSAGTSVESGASSGSGSSPPSRWATTRSRHRERAAEERPVGVANLDEARRARAGRPAPSRSRAAHSSGGRPHSSSARPGVARRRVTSSWR